MIVTRVMKGIRFPLLVLLVLAACSDSKTPTSNQASPITPPIPLANTSNDSKKENKDGKDKVPESKDKTPESKDKGAPCCHGSAELMFRALDAQGKLSGLSADLHPLKDYKGTLSIHEGVQNLEGSKLRVRAGMKGMDHGEIEFITKQTKQDEFDIEGVVFTMPGTWDVAFQFIDQNEEVLDSCQCKIDVKEQQ